MRDVARPTIATPLGLLKLQAVLGQTTVELGESSPVPHSSFRRAGWTSEAFRVSFWMGTIDSNLLIDPDLLPGQGVEMCYGVLWRVEALQDMADGGRLLFRCSWAEPSPLLLSQTTGYDYGATVDAWRWQGGEIDLCIGTSNEEDLAYMDQNGAFSLPKRWYGLSGQGGGLHAGEPSLVGVVATHLNERGLQLSYPALHAGEVCHAHMAVAWKHLRDTEDGDSDADTWIAVDLAPTQTVRAVYPHLFDT